MAARTPEEIDADQRARVDAALTRMPKNIATLIERSRMRLTLCLTLHTLFTARRREDITRAAGYFNGLVFALNMASDMGTVWTADEWKVLEDYGNEMEARALLALESDA
jgi:hypothetical protein